MKTMRLNLGFVKIYLRIGWPTRARGIEIKKYEVVSRDFVPEIERSLLRRLKMKSRSAGFPTCCIADFQVGTAADETGAGERSPGCGFGNPRYSRFGNLRHETPEACHWSLRYGRFSAKRLFK
jgi:hypothetical protein